MSFLISNAWADAAAQASTQPSLMAQMLPLVLDRKSVV